jgi:hypothetical protein
MGCHQHPLGGLLDRSGIGGAEIVFQKARDSSLTGNLTKLAAADVISQGDSDSLGAKLGFTGNADAVQVFFDGLATLTAMTLPLAVVEIIAPTTPSINHLGDELVRN